MKLDIITPLVEVWAGRQVVKGPVGVRAAAEESTAHQMCSNHAC